jgi:hypothetical protein
VKISGFWRSVLMAEAGGDSGGGGGAVAVTSGTPAVSPSTGGGGGSTDLSTTGGTGTDTTGADSTPAKFRAMEGKRLSTTAGTILKTAEDAQPEHKAFFRTIIPRALSIATAFRERYGSWEPINKMQETLEAIGRTAPGDPLEKTLQSVVDRINAYEAQSADVDDSDALFAAGDPKLLQKMTEHKTPDGKVDEFKTGLARQALVKLMPHAMTMWNQFAPKSYSAYFGKLQRDHMKNALCNIVDKDGKKVGEEEFELPRRVARLEKFIPRPDKEGKFDDAAIKAFAEESLDVLPWLKAYVATVGALATTEPEDLTPKGPAPEDRIKAAQDSERGERQKRWVSERNAYRQNATITAYRAATEGLEVTGRQMEEILAAVDAQSAAGLQAQRDYKSKVEAYFGSSDEAGYKSLYVNYFKEALPRLVKEHVGKVLGSDPKRRKAATSDTQTAPRPGVKPQQVAGVVKVADGPRGRNDYLGGPEGLIAGFASNMEMILAHQCIAAPGNHWGVKAGTKVRW